MPFSFNCPSCQRLIAAEVSAGTQVQCPMCGEAVTVPAPNAPPAVGDAEHPPSLPAPAVSPASGMAVAALVCSLVGLFLCPPLTLIGVVLGVIALVRSSREPRRYGGSGLAIGAICAGGVALLVWPFLLAILLPSFSRAREMSKRLVCAANMKGLHTSMQIYAQGAGGGYMDDMQVLIDTGQVTAQQFVCPSSGAVPGDMRACYIYISGQTPADDPRNVVLYEKPENHADEGGNVLFLDGHVDYIRPYSRVDELVAETERRLAQAQRRQAAKPNAP